ncbi:MAG: phosphoribosylanthranilate isomerase [Acidobacteriota bacterium]|jgi:phosphoribosylanthranilate isomerase|nr:phosphoribosylanthranilate isomerase [Acidobacteriota bacterium]
MIVKVCGITNLEDALAAVEAGADALGFNFYRQSPRYIAPEVARRITRQLPSTVMSVGVFVNESEPDEVARIMDSAGLTAVQLHGDESPEYCYQLRDRFTIKAVRARGDFEPQIVRDYETDAILLDAYTADARGGTGRVVDWEVARRVRELVPQLFLAGGLSPENVAEAIAAVEPYAVDACSSLESAPGRKDTKRVGAFVAAARRAH